MNRADLPLVDYDFRVEFSVTLPAHQWQLLLRASHDEMLEAADQQHEYGLAQAHQEIAHRYRIARH